MNKKQFDSAQRMLDGAALLVWGVWFILTATLTVATATFARRFPWLDDFSLVPFVIERVPLSLEWLWHPHNEHRIPLPKLFLWSTLKADDGGFILAKYLYIVGISASAALLLLSLRKARGYLVWTDVVIPLLILGFQNLFNTLWFFQAPFILATILTYLLLALEAIPKPAMWHSEC
jgi:hypothetical protein